MTERSQALKVILNEALSRLVDVGSAGMRRERGCRDGGGVTARVIVCVDILVVLYLEPLEMARVAKV